MKSRYSHIVTLIAAILAFVPVMGVDYLLDNYVRVRERAQVEQSLGTITERIQTGAYSAIDSLRTILADSPSLCTPTFIANVHKQMAQSLYLKQVLVENADGAQYCDAFGSTVSYSPLSASLAIPGHTETVTVIKLADLATPVLKLTQAFGNTRMVSAFVPLVSSDSEGLLNRFKPTAMVRVSVTDGTSVLVAGDPSPYDSHGTTEYVSAEGFAGELPIRVEAAVPFAIVRADYADLDVSFTIIACLMSGAFLVLALQYVRRSKLPAFDLERAIASGELKPYYQPVINLKTGALAGCEVLCRWEKRNGEVVMPGAFIEYAEVTGLAIPMTLSLMQQVRADLGDLCLEMPDMKVSINLFEGHFRDGSVIEDVQAIFGGSNIAFRQLVFEITERYPLSNSTTANTVIAGLHALGARLAMDDVGTGHSNLAYMQTLGVDVIKIDRVFIDMIKPDTKQNPVLDGLISMCRDLGTEIIAEGVETEAQALYLRGRGVVMAQGFLFAPALKVVAFRELARALNGRPKAPPLAVPELTAGAAA
ncbi:MAG: EAL domain-containing protein [Devosia nanyangense]|uniref:EAL domain-containing protein n=1 Tax=Devosia nanyangense TaxID=1228055 RepID=A0A933KZJ9_9HYPH|nr:EAL domain-containing protein [Devosia nanyangense]